MCLVVAESHKSLGVFFFFEGNEEPDPDFCHKLLVI